MGLDMDSLRLFVKETFPMLLLEERLRTNERCSSFEPTELYSPRTWRLKLGKNGKSGGATQEQRSASKESAGSKRSGGSKARSPRGKKERSNSPSPSPKEDKKEKKDKKDKKEEKGAESPRASKAAKSKKDKK